MPRRLLGHLFGLLGVLLALFGIGSFFATGCRVLLVRQRLDRLLGQITLASSFFALSAGLARLCAPLLLSPLLKRLLRFFKSHSSFSWEASFRAVPLGPRAFSTLSSAQQSSCAFAPKLVLPSVFIPTASFLVLLSKHLCFTGRPLPRLATFSPSFYLVKQTLTHGGLCIITCLIHARLRLFLSLTAFLVILSH